MKVFDEAAIRKAVDPVDVVAAVAEGFRRYSAGEVVVPPVGLLHFEDPPGDVHIKYGAIVGDDYYVVKIASGFYENVARGLPVSDGSMLLYDRWTGRLLAILADRGWLTEVRTGAAGAVAAQLLAPREVRRIGIVGTGVQARFQLRALPAATGCREVLAWGRDEGRLTAYAAEMAGEGWSVETTGDLAEVAASCDLIVTVTPAREPLIRSEWVRPGTHITAVGSDNLGKQELDPAIFGKADIVAADSISQTTHHGECAHGIASGHLDITRIMELGSIVADPGLGRTSEEQITVADLTGVAVQDIQVAKMAWAALVE
ncbi:MAG: ornithine cyclodeaminase family protein [Acidimicrobiia bacterium]|nr:ornithine cyclodeaminase family protein [Acidimicrobiia bacterium]